MEAEAGVGAASIVCPAEVLWLTAVPVSGQAGAGQATAVAAVEPLHIGAGVLAWSVAVIGKALVSIHAAVAVVTEHKARRTRTWNRLGKVSLIAC